MTTLSVNLNKVALLRNARGGCSPDLLEAARLVIAAGVRSITVHPRSDGRHITLDDVIALRHLPLIRDGQVELNVEADLRQPIIDLVSCIRPTQYTIVPSVPGELTSMRGWRTYDDQERLRQVVARLKSICRLSIFCDPEESAVVFLQQTGVHAVEINTRLYAESWERKEHAAPLAEIRKVALTAVRSGLRVHGGHDLTLQNLPELLAQVRFDELSIGHHLISEAVLLGLAQIVPSYLSLIAEKKSSVCP
ncbi:pyridoxine 5'-phosphate synthase [Pajaroellobacter abortibovis]|uniref:Pyridoxine 5'-phosphate synthase n=1 Tax=Pajaroellobacter abortibovis TaxID=1882918 RepID=A0A1L6MYZ4_9BACT|nr:pyridoxine 5'-phosphate synthase [Pajaroellobacter abortibovis]APS00763.1 pyridoxine 5'-phosphate synthase [Pajaroellobacter abortibovis]